MLRGLKVVGKSTSQSKNAFIHGSIVMNTIRLSTFVLLVCSVAWPQYHGPVGNGHDRKRWAEPPEQHNATHLSDRPALRETKRAAEELANLSQTLPADVEAISH